MPRGGQWTNVIHMDGRWSKLRKAKPYLPPMRRHGKSHPLMGLTIYNKTRSTTLGNAVEVAETPWTRLKGLLGRRSLDEGGGLLITPCNSIHMFFMRFAIDVAFLDQSNRVVHATHAIKPWRATWFYPKAVSALELPAGTLKRTGTEEGDELSLMVPDGPAGQDAAETDGQERPSPECGESAEGKGSAPQGQEN